MSPTCIFTGVGALALALATTTHAGPITGACCDSLVNPGDCVIQTEADCIVDGGAWAGADTDCSECSQNNCLEDDANCQEPNIGQFAGGTILTSAATADNFVPTVSGTITSICFWGAYIAGTADCDTTVATDTITVTFYQNIETIPPAPNLALMPFVTTATVAPRRLTGQVFTLANFDLPVNEYEYTATLDVPFSVTAGECVWIEIENTISSTEPLCAFFWEVSTEFVTDPILGDGDDLGWNVTNDSSNDFDMAWCIDQEMGDAVTCALPFLDPPCVLDVPVGRGRCVIGDICAVLPEATCLGAGGAYTPDIDCREPCNVPSPFVGQGGQFIGGCSDPACCTLVCTEVPFCCLTFPTGWDALCVDVALNIGCVESPLCGGAAEVNEDESCQRFSTANAFNSTFDPLDPLNDQFTGAEDFTPLQSGAVSIICWQGILAPADPQNVPADNFTVTYYDTNANGLPGAVIGGPFSQSGGTLLNLAVVDTNLDAFGFDINEYTADHAAVAVSAGECYWLEIKNGVGTPDAMGDASSWFWELASNASTDPPFYKGNGRIILDGQADGLGPNGYDIEDFLGGMDLSICFKDLGPLQSPTCGLDTLYLTGTEEAVCAPFLTNNACVTMVIPHIFLGYSSGCLDTNGDGNCIGDEFEQRRSAQPFTLQEGNWHISQLFVYGFVPDGISNETMNYQIFSRTGMDRPVPADTLVVGSLPFGAVPTGTTNPQVGGFPGALHSISVDFNLTGGDYYLTLWASNAPAAAAGILETSNFAWFANADTPLELNNICTLACVGATPEDVLDGNFGCDGTACASTVGNATFWRARNWPPLPDGFGFGQYGIDDLIPDDSTFDPPGDPDPDPDDLYNASMFVRGGTTTSVCGNAIVEPGETCDPPGPGCSSICQTVEPVAPPCPWDCGGDNNQDVGIVDFLALLGQWTQIGTSCDFGLGDPGVGINEFLDLLGHWGPCP